MKMLENSNLTGLPEGIPYGVCVGNHDQTPNGQVSGSTTFFNKYFGTSRFQGRSYYGGHYGTNNDNFYDLFTVGNFNFLVIYFEFDNSSNFTASGGPLDWGENLVKNNPTDNVIVVSHYVLTAAGTFNSQGNSIYKRFKIYPNFKIMLGGHVPDSAAEAMRVNTYNGNKVYTVLSNYQGRPNGGNGLLRIYEFDPANNNVSVKTYSPYTSKYETDANSQFNMNVSLITNTNLPSASSFQLINEVKDVQPGTSACATWSSLEKKSNYEWYAEVLDGKNKITSPVWSFTTGNSMSASNNKPENESVINSQKELFTLYPNPNTTNKLTLYFSKEIKGKISINIFNTTGNILLQKKVINTNHVLTIQHNLPPGVYIVVMQKDDMNAERKLLIVK
jgi:hypothetical protein